MTEKQMTESLGDALPREIQRVEELIPLYETIPMGVFAAGMMRASIRAANHAIAVGDVVAMLRAFGDLKGYKA